VSAAPCPTCDSTLEVTSHNGKLQYACSEGHMWAPEALASEHPLDLVPQGIEGLLLTANGAWMVRRPRGSGEGWILDLTGASTRDDWFLLNARAEDALRPIFDTPQAAVEALSAALNDQVRHGQVWARNGSKERFLVTHVDHFGDGPDGTVFVRSLDDPEKAFSPGDFRLNHKKLSEHEQ